jgi:hypothetical protein
MFFGLTNSPATFQTMMNDIFHIEIYNGQVIVYMDDILIFSITLEQHHEKVRNVVQILHKHKLSLKLQKCLFDQTQIEYLGLIISKNTIEMDPVKVKGVTKWPQPTTKKELQSFLGFCNFYR